jgi:hypothetical protein
MEDEPAHTLRQALPFCSLGDDDYDRPSRLPNVVAPVAPQGEETGKLTRFTTGIPSMILLPAMVGLIAYIMTRLRNH